MKTIHQKKTEQFSFVLKLDPDGMKLFVDVEPTAPVEVPRDTFLALIKEGAPRADLHDAVIDDILRCVKAGEKVEERRIAKGRPAEAGPNGKLLLLVKKFSPQGQAQVDDKGFAKFGELRLFDNVEAGQQVARIYPPKPGIDGVDALGEKVSAAAGQAVKVQLDETVVSQSTPGNEYEVVVAKTAGFLKEESGRLSICSELLVQGDLDLRMGSINFIGSVKITGDVPPGLLVQGKLGVEVGGAVNEGSIISSHGSVRVAGFLGGGEQGRVFAAKRFYGSVLQRARVEAQEDIIIERESVDSIIRTQKFLRAEKARCIGGEAFVVSGAAGKDWGNQTGVTTKILLCSDVEAKVEYTDLVKNIAKHEQALSMLKMHLGPMATNPTRVQYLKGDHRQKMQQLIDKQKQIEESLKKILTKKSEMLAAAHGVDGVRVNVLEKMHPGVQVFLGEQRFLPKDLLSGPVSVRFSAEKKEFEVAPLEEFQALEEENLGGEHGQQGKKKR